MSDLTPEERAHHDALWDAVQAGIYGEDALAYADRMRGTVLFNARALHYATADLGTAIMGTLPGRALRRLASMLAMTHENAAQPEG